MANGSLDTGEFNEYGEWQSYRNRERAGLGPSPFPLLILLMVIALLMLLRPQSEPELGPYGSAGSAAVEKR